MTRKEQIDKKFIEFSLLSDGHAHYYSFISGIEWADLNPDPEIKFVIEKTIKALEKLSCQEICFYEKGSHTWEHDSNCVKCETLESWKKLK